MPDPIQKTNCVSPDKKDGKPGQEAAVMRSLWPLIVGAIAAAVIGGLIGGAWGGLLGGAGLTASVQLFLDWWLNRRLLCLGGDRCALGIVWSVEPAEGKPFPESFDDDFSLNLLLSPAKPGDGPDRFATQADLVQEHPSIKAAGGLTTFGNGVVALSVKGCMEKDIEQETFLNTEKRGVASVDVPDDPDSDQNAGATTWEEFLPGGGKSVADLPSLWAPNKTEGALPEGWQKSSLPNTQLLHVEFEGTTIANLQGVLLVVGILGSLAAAAAANAGAAGGAGAAAAALWSIPALALLLLLFALLTSALSHHGSASDSADDPLSGDPKPVGTDTFGTCGQWDQTFNLVGVIGRWIYDAGHSRGWNELHPVKFIQLLATAESEAGRQQLAVDPKDPSKGNLKWTRPTNDAGTKEFLTFWCREVASARDPAFQNQQRQALTDLHPSLPGSDVR